MKKMKIIKKQEGFSILEMMVTMSLFLVVLGSVYLMVVHYGDVSRTEHSRLHMQQDSRFMMTHFTQELKDAGAVLTIASTGEFLGGKDPYFNGIFPLNHDDYPDGVIVAAGDPEAVTKLTDGYVKEDDGNFLTVETTTIPGYVPGEEWDVQPWKAKQKGIIIGPDGYFVFEVKDVPGETTIEMRELPVYYSGLLNAKTGTSASAKVYMDIDPDVVSGDVVTGDAATYPKDAPVIRLTSFAIYIFKEVKHPQYAESERMVRQLIRISDTKGDADPLAEYSQAVYSVISENIYDMQIAYRTYENFGEVALDTTMDPNYHYFAGDGSSTDRSLLLTRIRQRQLKQLDINLVSTTDEYGGRGETSHKIPPIGDRDTYEMPPGKYNLKILSLVIEPRNYNIFF